MTDRSGSETRQRVVQINVRLTPEELAQLTTQARKDGYDSIAEYLRSFIKEV